METKSFKTRVFKKELGCRTGAVIALNVSAASLTGSSGKASVPAILGGNPVRTITWPSWPVLDTKEDEELLLKVLRSGRWWRGSARDSVVAEFEMQYAEALGVNRCLAMVNGTNSLITSLRMLDVGGSDEVIVTPYTFIATTHAILETVAMPVFADVDPETFQIDPDTIREKITPRTKAIMPVHILGLPSDEVKSFRSPCYTSGLLFFYIDQILNN